MRFINRKVHPMLHYMTGILLIASPWLFNFADVNAAKWVAIIVGVMVLLMSFMTDYEGGAKKVISMSTHLTVDMITGIFLAVSPWLFNFDEMVYLPHLLIGIFEIGASLFTERESQHSHGHIDRGITPAH